MDRHAPLIKRRVKGKNSPWMIKEIMDLRNERDELRRVFDKTKSKADEKSFKRYKNCVNNKINSAKRNYFLKKCNDALTSAQVWDVYNELSNFRKKVGIQFLPFLKETRKFLFCRQMWRTFKRVLIAGFKRLVPDTWINGKIIDFWLRNWWLFYNWWCYFGV